MGNVSITRVNLESPNGCMIKIEECKEEAYWFIGLCSVCDKHFKFCCEKLGIDWRGCVDELAENCGYGQEAAEKLKKDMEKK